MAVKYILVDAWNTLVTETGINTRLVSLLDRFETPKIIVTNANEEEKVKFGIVNMPYPVFSLAHQPNKTDPLYFKKLLSHLSVKAEEVVYFEHHPQACESAISIGIQTHWQAKGADLQTLEHFLSQHL